MAEKPKIGIGYRIGMLTVTEASDERKGRYTVWKCRCDCGNEIQLDTRCLQRGTRRDCGCNTAVRPGMVDLAGQRYGKLVCLSPSDEKDNTGSIQWLCRCDCGNLCLASRHQLRAGYKKSCGCLSSPPLKDYVGKRFHMLTVIAYAGKQNGMHRWRCLCDCGRETIVGQTPLQSGKTKSCGCLVYAGKNECAEKADQRGLIEGTCVSTIEARMNKPPIASNTSGHNGVYKKKANDKWSAQITFKGKTYYLGSFYDLENAVKARKRGEEVFDDFLDWYYAQYPERKSGTDRT